MHLECGIRVLQWETEHMPLALEAWSLNHWTTKEVPNSFHLYSHLGATLFLDTSRFIIEDLSYDCVYKLSSVQFHRSVVSDSLQFHHQLLEFAQTYVCRVSDVIQPSHPLSSPSPPAFNLSQPQDLFQ